MNIEQGVSTALLWDRVRMNLNGAAQSQKDWEEQIYSAGLDLLVLRKRYENDNAGFGRQCKERRINLNPQNRAALLSMAKEPDKFKRVLANTTRRSLQLIYANEWGLSSARKTPQPEPPPVTPEPVTVTKPTKPKKSEARVDYDQRLSEAKAEIKEKVKAKVDAKVKAQAEAYKAKLDREYERRTEELNKREKRVMLRLDSIHGIVTKEHDTAIIKCLHPDHVAALGPEVVAMHEAGWRAYHRYRDYIIIKPREGGSG